MLAAVALSPLLYVSRRWIEGYLGRDEAERLKAEAAL
jgi:hypothetical protein